MTARERIQAIRIIELVEKQPLFAKAKSPGRSSRVMRDTVLTSAVLPSSKCNAKGRSEMTESHFGLISVPYVLLLVVLRF